jgi:hypothetical protein
MPRSSEQGHENGNDEAENDVDNGVTSQRNAAGTPGQSQPKRRW